MHGIFASTRIVARRSLALLAGLLVTALLVGGLQEVRANELNKSGRLYQPYLEWSLSNPNYSGNPFDIEAWAIFTHQGSGETRRTGMFYDGGTTWKFRFTATRTGTWTVRTESSHAPALAGKTGTVTIGDNNNPKMKGFVSHHFVDNENGSRWTRSNGEAFIPQYVMYYVPTNTGVIDGDIRRLIRDHGFTGFHVPVFCRWFDINSPTCSSSKTNPDRRTFEVLEAIILKTYAEGGVTHIWKWGDHDRGWTPLSNGGINGPQDRRIQRYIAARLGPLPGWTMGYGFDLFEWVSGSQLQEWHRHMHSHMGWKHYLGGRGHKNSFNLISDGLDYSAYEQHRPSYDTYVETLRRRSQKPSFSEDRFRIRQGSPHSYKDYDHQMTLDGLWNSAMAGGVANIWGRVDTDRAINEGRAASRSYDNREQIKTYSRFFEGRFRRDMRRDNGRTDGGYVLRSGNTHFLFFKRNADTVRLNLNGMQGRQPAIAVDARRGYQEINLGNLDAKDQTWRAPYRSDWAIAVGSFGGSGGGGEVPITVASECHLFEGGDPVPAGFGVPYDTVNGSRETLLTATCTNSGVTVAVGTGAPNQYIYRYGYEWRDNRWQRFEFQNNGGNGLVNNTWHVGSAEAKLARSSTELLNPNNYIAYVCTWTGSNWKCGCRDSACNTAYWQLQGFQHP